MFGSGVFSGITGVALISRGCTLCIVCLFACERGTVNDNLGNVSCIAVLILVLVIWFVYKKRPELFMRSRKSTLPYTVGEDTIYGVDFAERIADALARTDYREAVRLLYLQTLKQLSDGKRIDWQLYKTPTQYIYEVRLPAFRQMTNHFLRVRYGNFEATETLFHAMRDLQKEVEKGGAA